MNQEQINKDMILLQIAMAKQILELKHIVKSLIKQEELVVKEEPEYYKYFK